MKKLTALEVARFTKTGRYAVGGGAYLQIGATGGKSWCFRYMVAGRPTTMGLGPFDLVTLAEAREMARDGRRLLLQGIDPLQAKKARLQNLNLDAARSITFADATARYIASNRAGWSERHAKIWIASVETHLYPRLGGLPVAAIDTRLVLQAIETLWKTNTVTASLLRARIESVLDYARVMGWRTGENPARWRGHLAQVLQPVKKITTVEPLAAMSYDKLPAFMVELRGCEGIPARALEFTILTACRTGEVRGARWAEIDLEKAEWAIPAARMKAGKPHRVPLSARAVDILTGLGRHVGNDFLFPGRDKRPIGGDSMRRALASIPAGAGLTVHGFRSSFKDWAAEQTNFANEVSEMALAHAVGNKVEAAYRRGDMFDKRRRLMAAWDQYCGSPPAERGQVVPMRTGA